MYVFRANALRHSIFVAILTASVLGEVACAGIFSLDEGERLSEQIGKEADKLRRSSNTESVVIYVPKKGVDQHYSVGLAKVRYQPHPPYAPPYPGLTVTVEEGHGGFCNAHVKHVGVPRNFDVNKFGESTEIVLKKIGDEIDV
jgi:hypothetical protein